MWPGGAREEEAQHFHLAHQRQVCRVHAPPSKAASELGVDCSVRQPAVCTSPHAVWPLRRKSTFFLQLDVSFRGNKSLRK